MKLLQNLGILISGRGSNMEAILKAIKKQKIPINPTIVISNKPNARGLKIAQRLGVKTLVIESKNYKGFLKVNTDSEWKKLFSLF